MHENQPVCPNCDGNITPGEHHRLTDQELTHDRCIVDRSTPVKWDRSAGALEVDDIEVLMAVDAARDLPSWVVGAAQNDRLRDGTFGTIDMMQDGSVRFRANG